MGSSQKSLDARAQATNPTQINSHAPRQEREEREARQARQAGTRTRPTTHTHITKRTQQQLHSSNHTTERPTVVRSQRAAGRAVVA